MECFNYLNNMQWWGYLVIIIGGIIGIIISGIILYYWFSNLNAKAFKIGFFGFDNALSVKERDVSMSKNDLNKMMISIVKSRCKSEIEDKITKLIEKHDKSLNEYKKIIEKHAKDKSSNYFKLLGDYYAFYKFVTSIKEIDNESEYLLNIFNIPIVRVNSKELQSHTSNTINPETLIADNDIINKYLSK